MQKLTHLALVLVALGALAGCGKAVPVQKVPGLVDDALTRKPLQSAREIPADQEQASREQQTKRPETTKVGAPSNEKN
jgi:hypothetical protein